jgi:predicted AAA+ superfamily ATPase
VRYDVDKKSLKGGYILTGSATPKDDLTIHSGAGRYGRLRMSTMTLSEMGLSSGRASLGSLLDGKYNFKPVVGSLTLNALTSVLIKGGWPGLLKATVDDGMRLAVSYLETISTTDVSKADGVSRDPLKIMTLLRSLARNTTTYVSNETLRRDMSSEEEVSSSSATVTEYLTLLKRIFVLTELPAWEPALKSTVRLRSSPKRFLFEPSLTVAALGANQVGLLADLKLLGGIFEALVLHDLLVYADANDSKVYHYYDNADLEIDAIVEARDGRWGAMEIKLGNYNEELAANNLLRLKAKMTASGQKAPVFMAVVTGVGSILRLRDDGVLVVPIDHLGA